MEIKNCLYCEKPIPYNKSKGMKSHLGRKFCSRECSFKGANRRGVTPHPERMKKCEVCGKVIKKEKNRNWNMYAKKRFCSRECNVKSQSKKVIVNCARCGKELKRFPSHVRGNAYCSQKCRQNKKEFTCGFCGTTFVKRVSERIRPNVYCSKACADKGRKVEKIKVACNFCGDEIERYPSDMKKAKDRGYTFFFCSHKCRAAMIAAQFDPPKPYQGKHTSKPRNGHRTRQWRKAVKERDNFTCQDCGATKSSKMLAVHHIKPFALYPELAHEVSNGLTLCYECHEKRHSLH